ncbi:hypothetical protein ACLKA6_018563 [Drosophila palustris]
MSDKEETRESTSLPDDQNEGAEEQLPEQDVDKIDSLQRVQHLMELVKEIDDEETMDLTQKPGEEEGKVSASRETIAPLEIKEYDLPISVESLQQIDSTKPKKKKKKVPITVDGQSVYSNTSSRFSNFSKGRPASNSKVSKASRSSKSTTRSNKKTVKKGHTKAADEPRHSSKINYSIFNKRQSDVSVFSKVSSIKSNSWSRSSRMSRPSVHLSEDSYGGDMRAGLRKAKRSSFTMKIAKKPIKEEDLLHSDDPSELSQSDSRDGDVVPDAPMTVRYKLLEMLKDLPDIDELSATSLHSFTRLQLAAEEPEAKNVNEGKFVEPVSLFDEIPDTQSFEPPSKEEYEGYEDHTTESSSWSRSTYGSDDTLMNLPSLTSLVSEQDLFTHPPPKVVIQSVSKDIIQKMTQVRIKGSQIDIFDTEDLEQRKIFEGICIQFIDDVIGRVVSKCEEESVRFKRLLDKEKMWHALRSLMDQLSDEHLLHDKLEKATTEHFMRKKRFVFIKTPKQFDSINYNRLKSALIEYDRNLEIEEETNKKVQSQVADLQVELNKEQNTCEQKLNEIEQIIRQTLLQNDNFDHLKSVVENVIKNMSKVRNEVSDMRRELLYTQHRFADMINKSEALEDLGYGLKMREYLTRQADAQVLLLKIDERNADLKRLHMKINYDVHALAHVRCKEQMCRRTNNRMKAKLVNCITSKNELREQIYQGKLKHNAIIREINKLKNDGTLLQYPVLLKDFDNTVDEMRAKRESVEKLRMIHNNLVQRIKVVEQMVKSRKKVARPSKASRKLPIMDASVVVTPLRLS